MGRIKSALEIALERTENVKIDTSSIDQYNAKQGGKKLANAFLAGSVNLVDEIKKTPKNHQKSLKQGIFDILITLPNSPLDEKRIELTGKGLQAIITNPGFSALYKNFTQIMSKYKQDIAKYEEVIRQQYAPRLRQKEEEISQQIGREVRIDPLQDPEFIGIYNQNMNILKTNYEGVIEQIKDEIRRMAISEFL